MMKIRFTLLLVLFSFTAFGQWQFTLTNAWQFGGNGALADNAQAMMVDNDGFITVVGKFSGSGDFDPDPTAETILTSAGGFDIFVARYSSAGEFIWAHQIGGTLDDGATALTLENGDPIVVGTFMGSVDFNPGTGGGEEEILTAGGTHGFILKLTSGGEFMWAKNFGGASGTFVEPRGIAIDVGPTYYIAGHYSGNDVDFDPGTGADLWSALGDLDIFVMRLDQDGEFNWNESMGGIGADQCFDIIESLNRIYIVGSYTGTAGFVSTELLGGGGFVARMEPSGDVLWAERLGGPGTIARSLVMDENDIISIGGEFTGTQDFMPSGSGVQMTSSGLRDGFILQVDYDGNFAGASRIGGPGDDYILDHIIDADANIYSIGVFGTGADFDPNENPGAEYFLPTGTSFISILDVDLGFLGARAIGDNGGTAWAIAGDAGRIFTTGSFAGTVDFDVDAGSSILTAQGPQDGFIQIIDRFIPAINITLQPIDVYTCMGPTSVQFTTAADGAANITYRWYRLDPDSGPIDISDGPIYSGVHTPTLTIDVSTEGPEGYYFCEINGDGADVTGSNIVELTINPLPPFAPDVTHCGPGEVTLFATGADPGNYRWYTQATGGTPIAGAVNASFTTPVLTASTPFYVSIVDGTCESERAQIFAYISTCEPAPGLAWVKQAGGTSADAADAIVLDGDGNIFVLGTFASADTDFDPGPGVETLTWASPYADMYLLKLDANGDFLWVKGFGGTNTIQPVNLKVDGDGNVYIYIEFRGEVDVDPGSGQTLWQSTTNIANQDVGVVKLDGDGNYLWGRQFGSGSNEYGGRLELAPNGDVFIAGMFQADFNISTEFGLQPLVNLGGTDVFVIRMNSDGDNLWGKSFGGTVTGSLNSIQDSGNDIAITDTHVFVTGAISATATATIDFDPGPGTANRTIEDNTAYILKLLAINGDFVDVYLLGGDSDGDQAHGLQVELGPANEIYVAGNFNGTIDFDPSAGVFEDTYNSAFTAASFMTKLTSDGSFVWTKVWKPFGQSFLFKDMRISASGDIYSLVDAAGIVDADPGPLVHQVSNNSLFLISVSVLKLNSDGDFKWITQAFRPFNISSGTVSGRLFIDPNDDVYVSGRFSGTVDFDPHACQQNLSAVEGTDAFYYKLSHNSHNICIAQDPFYAVACGDASVDYFVLAVGAPGIIYQWQAYNPILGDYEDISNGGRFSGTNTPTLTVSTAGATTGEFYRAVVSHPNADSRTSEFAGLDISSTPPSAPGATGVTSCTPGAFDLVATGGTSGGYRWYSVATGGNYISGEHEDTYTTPFINSTSTYYVSIYNGTCESDRTAATVTIGSSVTAPTTNGASTCLASASLTLTASGGTDGEYRWYTTASAGTAIPGETNGTYVTPVLTTTTDYYVSIDNGTCESTRTVVTATVNAGNTPPLPSDATRCGPGTLLLSASGGSDGDYRWYTEASGGTPIAGAVNSTYQTPLLTATTAYYVSIAPAGCESPRALVNAVIASVTEPLASNAVICEFGAIAVGASGGTDGNYRWYLDAVGGTPLAGEQNSTYITPNLSATTTYFVSLVDGLCESERVPVVVQVIPFPDTPVTAGASGCPGVNIILNASGGNDGDYRWYTVPTGGQMITDAVNGAFGTGPLTETTTFYVSLASGICEGPRAPVVATVIDCSSNQPPVIGEATASVAIQGSTTLSMLPFLSDPDDNLDLSTLRIVQQPSSGAVATIDNGILTIDYTGVSFSGNDEMTIEVCDIAGSCVQRVITIAVSGEITVYNAISPNGDGKNDTFHIQYIDVMQTTRSNKVTIFNRWGDVVFEIENYNNADRVFAGRSSNGNELPSGTYYYKIEIVGQQPITGYISLKR